MNWLDILILVSLAAAVSGGLGTGLVRGICNLGGLIIGIFLAGRYYETFGSNITFIHSRDVANVAAFLIILAIIVTIAEITGRILHKILSGIMLGWLDRFLGGVMGLGVGAVSWGALLALWVKFLPNLNGTVYHSFLAKVLLYNFPLVLNLLPASFDAVKNFFK